MIVRNEKDIFSLRLRFMSADDVFNTFWLQTKYEYN